MPKALSIAAQVAAYIIIGMWLASLYVLYLNFEKTPELGWARLTALFGSLEAVAFAAAGALFGTQVQKERVAKAEKGKEMGKRFAQLWKSSSSNTKLVFDKAATHNIVPDEVFNTHDEMRKLADEVLRE